jgi:hypothetical protein
LKVSINRRVACRDVGWWLHKNSCVTFYTSPGNFLPISRVGIYALDSFMYPMKALDIFRWSAKEALIFKKFERRECSGVNYA